jgi:hypothetical protein
MLTTPQAVELIRPARRSISPPPLATAALTALAAIIVLGLSGTSTRDMLLRPLSLGRPVQQLSMARPSVRAFGSSGEVNVRFTLPAEPVDYPLQTSGDPRSLKYQWVRAVDSTAVDSVRSLGNDKLRAPSEPGIYRLALVNGARRAIIDGLNVAVLVPFEQKLGPTINGYRIGTYLAERLGGAHDRPDGFVQVSAEEARLPISRHLRLGDLLSQDEQRTWPRYAAVDARLLDKVELVMAELSRAIGDSTRGDEMRFSVNSGFRTPIHNRLVRRSARDSRHQYGDAIDLSVDANNDGRITVSDSKLVALAVETVEMKHPELVGGLGIYASRRNSKPYVHIDARGKKVRWRG